MKAKSVVTIALLAFVGASLVVLAAKNLRRNPKGAASAASAAAPGAAESEPPPLADGVIAYYFHGNIRCPTCKSIEAYAHEVLQTNFADQLESGRMAWRVINYETPGNQHFAIDYQMAAPGVVLVRMKNGVQEEWKNLDRVWELVGDKPEFAAYVKKETQAFVDAAAPQAASAIQQAGSAPASPPRPAAPEKSGSKSGLPRLVDLGAGKCIPCRMMAPILEELKSRYAGELEVQFIDVWENPDAAEQYGIEMIPTQIFFDGSGKELYRHSGFFSKEEILAKWKEFGVDLRPAADNAASPTEDNATSRRASPNVGRGKPKVSTLPAYSSKRFGCDAVHAA